VTGQSDSSDKGEWEHVARLEACLLRVLILELFAMDGGRTLSPEDVAYELQERTETSP
jgi:hypothetical protein